MKEVIQVCNSLWASVIKKVDFDLFNKTIKFKLILAEEETETNHVLEIKEVESFLWVEKFKKTEEYDFKDWDYYELTSITLGNVQAYSDDKYLQQYSMQYNIVIEIWESALLVKSNKIIVDGFEYYLNSLND